MFWLGVLIAPPLVNAADLTRRTFVVGTGAMVVTPALGKTAASEACSVLFRTSAAPSAVSRVHALAAAVTAGRQVVGVEKHVKPHPLLRPLIAGAETRAHYDRRFSEWATDRNREYRRMLNADDGEFPAYGRRLAMSWATTVVTVQDRLSRRFEIPLERIELEMPDIFDPSENFSYFIKRTPTDVDPRPETLGAEFHWAFIAEVKKEDPEFGAILEERFIYRESVDPRWNRFSDPSPLGDYARSTGRRLTISYDEWLQVSRVEQNLIAERFRSRRPARNLVGTSEVSKSPTKLQVSSVHLSEFLSWLNRVRAIQKTVHDWAAPQETTEVPKLELSPLNTLVVPVPDVAESTSAEREPVNVPVGK